MQQLPYDWSDGFSPAQLESLREPGWLVRGMHSTAAVAVRFWLRVYDRLTIVGRDNLPKDRSYILVANHASHLDTLCLLSALPLRQLHRVFPLGATDYFCVNPIRNLLARVFVNIVPVDRNFPYWTNLGVFAHLLQKPGTVLILFPEGTRADGRELREFKQGVAVLAAGRDIPVVPCHLAGTAAALPKGAWFPRPERVRLTIGTPRVFAHLPANKESRIRICNELRDAVIALACSMETQSPQQAGEPSSASPLPMIQEVP